MNIIINIQPALNLTLRNPESSELGRNIVRKGILVMRDLGYEQFTFKKLAEAIPTTEASIYRYFENKHRLLLYFLSWYWNYIEYQATVLVQNTTDPAMKIRKLIEILTIGLPEWSDDTDIDKKALYEIVLAESSKTYLTKQVDSINEERLFKPYKDLCRHIGQIFSEYNPTYAYPRSLASSVVEMSHFQPYFMEHLPSLTDFGGKRDSLKVAGFLEELVFAALEPRPAKPSQFTGR
ncbi:MAG: TetR/AcrR family transcriptional regulator [Saprospiraceae bacterium]|nr:TetR/AcrR family transcriptional regulator [Saprospiraceae bacterium]